MGAAQRAGAELRELKRRTSGGRRKARKQGRLTNGSAPYDMVYVSKYDRDPEGVQRLKRDPVDSSVPGLSKEQVVKDVFSWRYHQQMRTYAIVKRLNERGILSAGKPGQYEPGLWSRQTVIQMLKNRSYIGEHWKAAPSFLVRSSSTQRSLRASSRCSRRTSGTRTVARPTSICS
jgi:hypothetical protein